MTDQVRILVVDDNADMLRLTSTQLRMAGYDVVETTRGTECLDLTIETMPDIVLLDVMLPDMDGFEVCRQLKQDTRLIGMQVALYSAAKVGPDAHVAGFEGGADEYIYQPITNRELLARVRSMVRTKRAEDKLRWQATQLTERIKELKCLYGISSIIEKPDITLEEIVEAAVELLPPAWQYPEITVARIRLHDLEFSTGEYRETPWQVRCDIRYGGQRAGEVKVCYLEQKPESDEGPFLREEVALLHAVAGRLAEIAERAATAKALQDSEAIAQVLLDALGDRVMLIERDGSILYANEAMAHNLGRKVEELIGTSAGEMAAFDQDGQRSDHFYQVLRTGEPCTFEYERQGRWFENTFYPIVDTEGEVGRIAILVHEFTEHKRIEASLQESQKRYRDLVENIEEIVYAMDLEGVISYVSPRIEPTFGYTPSEVVGHHYLKFVDLPDSASDTEAMPAIWAEQASQNTYRVETKSGDVRWVRASSRPSMRDGQVQGIQGSLLDVTEQLRTEEQVRNLSEAVQQSPSSAMIVDVEGKIEYVNRRFVETTGYAPEEVVGENPRMLKSGQHQIDHYQQMWDAIVSGGQWRGEFVNKRKNGDLYWELASISPITNSEGETTHFVKVSEDITERKRVEDRIKASLEEKDVLLREIHHRVKNNLQVVSSLLDMQSLTVVNPAAIDALQDSRNRIKTMAFVHERLYQSEGLSTVSAGEFVTSLVSHLVSVFEGAGTAIHLATDLADIRLDLDAAIPCGLIINELVSNALKHAFPPDSVAGPEVRIALRPADGGDLEVMVSDNGQGMPEGFDPLTSTSLGLRLVSMLTKQLQGTLMVERVGGTTVRITIPGAVWSPQEETIPR